MLIKISDADVDKLLSLCKEKGIEIEATYESSFNAYVDDEFNRCESYYRDSLGEDTLKSVRKEVEEELEDIEMDFIVSMYENKLNRECDLMDEKPIAVYTIRNTLGVELKQMDDLNDVAVIKYGNELYNCDVLYNTDGEPIIKIGELELPLDEFVRV